MTIIKRFESLTMNTAAPKYIFVTGGVTSSLGKGILCASLGRLLQAHGYRVSIVKLDPYINVDPGTLNPYEHGECYVTDDGSETDLDLGHYERFLNIRTSRKNNATTGQVYWEVIQRERRGDFLGKTVQVIPHITDEIKRRIYQPASDGYDIIIIEIGGTVGDIESLPFIEALRQVKHEQGEGQVITLHLTLIPYLKTAEELKTKPTQHSVKELLQSGVQPDVLVCRTEKPLTQNIREKLALFCNVSSEAVVEAIDCDTIYEVPLRLQKEGLDRVTLQYLGLPAQNAIDLSQWEDFVGRIKNPLREINVALIGKYTALPDAYKSISEAFVHAGAYHQARIRLHYLASESITEENADIRLHPFDGLLIAPGFGDRGIEGKIAAARYGREKGIPTFGICLGMQCAVIEFARHVIGWREAHSTEFEPRTPYPVIDLMESQKQITEKGGTMRLGAYECAVEPDSLLGRIYGTPVVRERHRHRFEFNNQYLEPFQRHGLRFSGRNPQTGLAEAIELPGHPWFVGVQFHPEYQSTVASPHPLFVSFVEAALAHARQKQGMVSSKAEEG